VIDVEKNSLGALEQDALAGAACRVELTPARADIGQDLRRNLRECRQASISSKPDPRRRAL
jgi:hypothetical protein